MTDAIQRVHKRMDDIESKGDRLGEIVRGNGDIGLRGWIIQLDGRLSTVETYIKESRIWTRALVIFGVGQIAGIVILLYQMANMPK